MNVIGVDILRSYIFNISTISKNSCPILIRIPTRINIVEGDGRGKILSCCGADVDSMKGVSFFIVVGSHNIDVFVLIIRYKDDGVASGKVVC